MIDDDIKSELFEGKGDPGQASIEEGRKGEGKDKGNGNDRAIGGQRGKGDLDDGTETGNIQVGIRIKPSSFLTSNTDTEIISNSSLCCWTHNDTSIIENRSCYSNEKYWTFDNVSSPSSINKDVYHASIHRTRIQKVIDGYNISILAYGQTGSGKTHTISGNIHEDGLLKLTIRDLFVCIEEEVDREFIIRISALEVYNEIIYDLLSSPKQKGETEANLKKKKEKDSSNICRLKGTDPVKGIIVEGLTEEIVCSEEDLLIAVKRAQEKQTRAFTDANSQSSRAHTLYKIIVESRQKEDDISRTLNKQKDCFVSTINYQHAPIRLSTISIVDLAGSERQSHTNARGKTLKESGAINKSLSSLCNVIRKLGEQQHLQDHNKNNNNKNSSNSPRNIMIPYRDSILTRLLQTSLSGNSIISIICTISFDPQHEQETISTLKFAVDCKKVKTNAKINQDSSGKSTLLAQYQREIIELKDLLQKQKQLTEEAKSLQTETIRPVIVLKNEKKKQNVEGTDQEEAIKSSNQNKAADDVISPLSNKNNELLNNFAQSELKHLNVEIEKEKKRSQELQQNVQRLKDLLIRGDCYYKNKTFDRETKLLSQSNRNENDNYFKRRGSCIVPATPLENLIRNKSLSPSSLSFEKEKSIKDDSIIPESELLINSSDILPRVENNLTMRRKSRLILTNDVPLTIKNVVETETHSPIHSPETLNDKEDNNHEDNAGETMEEPNKEDIENELIILRARERLLERDRKDINAQKYLLRRREEEQALELEHFRKSLEIWEMNLFDFMKKYNIGVRKVSKGRSNPIEVPYTKRNSNGQLPTNFDNDENDSELEAWTYEFVSPQLDNNNVEDTVDSFESHKQIQFTEKSSSLLNEETTTLEKITHHITANSLLTPQKMSEGIQKEVIELGEEYEEEEKEKVQNNANNEAPQSVVDKSLDLMEDDTATDNVVNKEFISDLFSSLPNLDEVLISNKVSSSSEAEYGNLDEISRKEAKLKVVSSKRQDRLNQEQFMETFRKVKLPVNTDFTMTIKGENDLDCGSSNIFHESTQKIEQQEVKEEQFNEKASNSSKHPRILRKRHDLKTVKERLQQTKKLSLFALNAGKVQEHVPKITDIGKPCEEEQRDHILTKDLTDKAKEDQSRRKTDSTKETDWASSLLYNGPIEPKKVTNSDAKYTLRKKKRKTEKR